MHIGEKGAALIPKDGWLACPACRRNGRLMKITDVTEARSLIVYCRRCRQEIVLDIDKGQQVICQGVRDSAAQH